MEIRKIENAHVALWLTKDVSWCNSWRWLGMLMVVPTLLVAAHICWRSRSDPDELTHNAAVCLWICANITWMVGEFFLNDGTRGYAKVFFYAGAALLAWHYGAKVARRIAR